MNELPHHPLRDMTEQEDHHFGHLWHFSEKPITLPTANPRDVFEELDRIARRNEHKATPHEL